MRYIFRNLQLEQMILIVCGLLIAFVLYAEISNQMNRIPSGIVTEKHYSAPYVTYTMSGKVNIPVVHPETFNVTITDGVKTFKTSVRESTYDSVDVGDTLNLAD